MFIFYLTVNAERKPFAILLFKSAFSPFWYFITWSDEARCAWIWKEIWLKFKTIPCAVMHERDFIVPPSGARGYSEGPSKRMCRSERLCGPCQCLIGLIQRQSVRATSFSPNHCQATGGPIVWLVDSEWEERGGGGVGGREKPLTSLSISSSFLTLSVCSITPSFGKRRQSKTERDERKTELSSDS